MKAIELDERTDHGTAEAGTALHRIEGPAKVSGRALYSVDVHRPGQLEAAVLRSPHPHARVLGVDTSAAEAMPGVLAVISGAVPKDDDTAEDADSELRWYEEKAPFFSEVARFVGDEIAAVAAVDLVTARRAVAAIDVEYEILPHVTDPEVAAERTEWDDPAWDVAEADVDERGDIAAIDSAPIQLRATFRTPTQIHNPLEPHATVAEWVDGELTLWVSTQGVNSVREQTAEAFGLDHNRVRVIADHVGGGFGAKQIAWKETIIASLLSRRTGRPVRLALDRTAETLVAGKRAATIQRLRLGADEDGTLIGIDLDAIDDGGAYHVGGEGSSLGGPALHLYRCANVRTSQRTVHTHTGPAVAFRAPGYVEATFALESMMDELARALDIDPIELRRRNYTERDQVEDLPWSSPDALRISMDRVADAADWTNRPDDPSRNGAVAYGRGFAAHEWMAGSAFPPGYVWIELNGDGSVSAATSSQDIGTGTRTVLTEIIAAELCIEPERIRMTVGDTAAGPPAPTSHGSTTAPTMAPAVAAAAAELRQLILEAAAAEMEAGADALELVDGRVVHDDGSSLTLGEVAEAANPTIIRAEGRRVETAEDVSVRPFGSVIADVEVDRRTGAVTVTRLVVAPDCGRILNPMLVDSQVIGGAIQGLGFAVTESQTIDHRLGVVLNPGLEDYLVPTAADIPEIVHARVDVPDFAANPLGVKGIGELPMIGVPAAIANAVADALDVRPTELPLTRRRILNLVDGSNDSIEVTRR